MFLETFVVIHLGIPPQKVTLRDTKYPDYLGSGKWSGSGEWSGSREWSGSGEWSGWEWGVEREWGVEWEWEAIIPKGRLKIRSKTASPVDEKECCTTWTTLWKYDRGERRREDSTINDERKDTQLRKH